MTRAQIRLSRISSRGFNRSRPFLPATRVPPLFFFSLFLSLSPFLSFLLSAVSSIWSHSFARVWIVPDCSLLYPLPPRSFSFFLLSCPRRLVSDARAENRLSSRSTHRASLLNMCARAQSPRDVFDDDSSPRSSNEHRIPTKNSSILECQRGDGRNISTGPSAKRARLHDVLSRARERENFGRELTRSSRCDDARRTDVTKRSRGRGRRSE